MTTFRDLGLDHEIMESLDELGFSEPTPIQAKVIPFILKSKKDLIALAQTGTGKTAAFGLPILSQIDPNAKNLQAIILCPTRELCLQITQDLKKMAKHSSKIAITAVYGGERIDIQISSLRRGTNIVVGTPGRVHDLIRRKILRLQPIRWLILDEADEMLDMGFRDDLDAILEDTPKGRQTLLFSATMSKSVYAITRKYMNESEEISVGARNVGTDMVSHEYYIVGARDRFDALRRILDSLPGVYGILFCRTKNETQDVADRLKQAGYDAEALHGDVSQVMRTKIMARFKSGQIKLLVATDVAARGIDVSNLSHIINYNLPDRNEAYTHRSGRTGRADKYGIAMSLVTAREVRTIAELERVVGKKIEYRRVPTGQDVCRNQVDFVLSEIEKTDLTKIESETYYAEIAERLQKLKKEDLIKYFIADKFSHLVDIYQNAPDLNADAKTSGERAKGTDHVSVEINIGKKKGMDVKGLFALINSFKKLRGAEIGRIELAPDHTIFTVERSRSADVFACLDSANFRGKRIEVTESQEIPAERENRRSRPSRGPRQARPSHGRKKVFRKGRG